jgi:hypothetical protein
LENARLCLYAAKGDMGGMGFAVGCGTTKNKKDLKRNKKILTGELYVGMLV